MRESDYKLAGQVESSGPAGEIGVRIMVNVGGGRALTSNEQKIVRETVDELHAKIVRQIRLEDPEIQRNIAWVCSRMIDCFPKPIHVRKIEDQRFGHPPTLIVTTVVGPITICQQGQRIRINWLDSDTRDDCSTLFTPSQWSGPGSIFFSNDSHEIIASSYEAAKVCIDVIVVNRLHDSIDLLIKDSEIVRRKLAANEPSKREHKK